MDIFGLDEDLPKTVDHNRSRNIFRPKRGFYAVGVLKKEPKFVRLIQWRETVCTEFLCWLAG